MHRISTALVSRGVGQISEIEQFESRIASVGEILGGQNFYAIPDMQRDYQWDIESGGQHGLNLWRSITEFVDEDPNQEDCYYLGTMIKYLENDVWMVVDGQQRLTTLSLMFMTIRDALDMAAANGVVGEIDFQNETYDMEGIGRAISRGRSVFQTHQNSLQKKRRKQIIEPSWDTSTHLETDLHFPQRGDTSTGFHRLTICLQKKSEIDLS